LSKQSSLYESPGETGKRGFAELECYRLTIQVMVKLHACEGGADLDVTLFEEESE